MLERVGLAITSLLSEAGLSLMGCRPLHPLPPPLLPVPDSIHTLEALWRQVEAVPRQDREESGFTSTIRVAKGDMWRRWADQVPGMAGIGSAPSGFAHVQVTTLAPGRAPLHALFHPPGSSGPTVIVIHGLYDSKLSRYILLTATALVRHGWGVLVPDMRWHGELLSRDWLPSLGIEEGLDLIEWGRWVQRQHPDRPVGLVGFSLGALDVVHALSHDAAGEVLRAGGIAVCPPAPLHRILQTLDRKARVAELGRNAFLRRFFQTALRIRTRRVGLDGSSQGLFGRFLEWLAAHGASGAGLTASRLLELADPLPLLPRCCRPLLVLASGNDSIYLERTAGRLAEAASANPFVRVIEIPGGGHIGQIGTYPQWMADILSQFFSLGTEAVAGSVPTPGLPGRESQA
jgi:predicted alpha/beta-fold hydrolase